MAQTPNDYHRNRPSGGSRDSQGRYPNRTIDGQNRNQQSELDYEWLSYDDQPRRRGESRSAYDSWEDGPYRGGGQHRASSSGPAPGGTGPRKKKRKKKGHGVLKAIYGTVVILAAVIVVCYGVYKVVLPAPEIPADNIGNQQMQEGVAPRVGGGLYPRREQTYTFLLTCPDQESGNADAIMVVTYDVPNQKLGMLSVPRDTLVKEDYPKINASYHGGIENLERVVTELLGIPIDFTVEIDLNGFIQLVDAVGGIDFDVPVEMYYEDYTQNLEIYYQPGMQHLTGQQTMEICRFRKNPDGTGYPLGDVQRSETIQNVMKTVAKKVVSWSSITKVNDYLKIFQDNVKTNLSATNMAWFASQALSLDLGTGVQGGTLPGDGTVKYRDVDWCYQLYPEEALTLINDLVNPYTQTMSLTDLNIFQAKK